MEVMMDMLRDMQRAIEELKSGMTASNTHQCAITRM